MRKVLIYKKQKGENEIRFTKLPLRNEICPCQSGKKFKNCCIFILDKNKQNKIIKANENN